MKNKTLLILMITIISFNAMGQSNETDVTLQTELNKLSFMAGEWQGSGWVYGRDGIKQEFTQTENIRFKVDNTTLQIEGLGKSGEKITHNALAIISYDKEKGYYNFRSYMANGMSGDFKAEFIDGKLYWYPAKMIRYIIYLNENKQWYERGEYNQGENWMQFFEMTLNKTKN